MKLTLVPRISIAQPNGNFFTDKNKELYRFKPCTVLLKKHADLHACFPSVPQPKGSSFTGENKEFYRFKLGAHTVIPGFEEAVAGMKVGGIRRIIVPQAR